MALTRATRPYVPGIRLLGEGTLDNALTFAVPEMFSVPKDGVHSANAGLMAMFNADYNNFRLTKGTYLLTDTLEIVFSKDVNIVCEEGVVIKLANNVRKHMLHFYGDRVHNFSWEGGELNGNWEGQGGEVLVSGHVDDVSHGIVISRWNVAKITDFFAHDCMGHHINHAGNNYFIAEHIRIDSHISTNFPAGGARGDGITGVSKNVYINDVSGYSSDDLIGIFPGATWIPGETDLNYLQVESIIIENINPKSKVDASGVTRYTWHGVTGGSWNGVNVKTVVIDNVVGEVQDGGVRYRCSPASGDDTILNGSADHISITGVHVYVNGKTTDQYETVAVMIGSHQQSTTLGATPSYFKNVHISDITSNTSDNLRTVIMAGHATIDNLNISDVSVNYTKPEHTASHVTLTGSNIIGRVHLSNCASHHQGVVSDTVMNARPVVRCSLNSNGVTTIRGTNLAVRRSSNGEAWIGSVLFTANFPNKVALFGEDLVLNAPNNFASAHPARGCHFTDRFLGRIRRDHILDGWVFEDACTQWDGSNFGRPNAANFTGYALVKDWKAGTLIRTTGSPWGECAGWVCVEGGAAPKWALAKANFDDSESRMTSTTTPTQLTPRMLITTALINASGFPGASGTLLTYTGAARTDRAGAYQEFTPASGTKKYMRTWNNGTSTWNNWLSVTFA